MTWISPTHWALSSDTTRCISGPATDEITRLCAGSSRSAAMMVGITLSFVSGTPDPGTEIGPVTPSSAATAYRSIEMTPSTPVPKSRCANPIAALASSRKSG